MEHIETSSPGRSLADASPAGSRRTDRSRQNQKSPILKALRLLEHLAHSSGPVALADLTRALQLPKPTSHRLAGMLERIGYVQKDPLTGRYCVGPALEDVSLLALRNSARTNKRRHLMEDLAERLGVRVNFAVLKSGKLMLVEWVDSVSLIRVDLNSGTKVPAHCSASGKLLMAFAPDGIREQFLKSAPFAALTKSTITTARALERELAAIRRRGYSEDDQEFLLGVCCLAVPVRNVTGHVVAGLAVMAPEISFSLATARRHLPDLRACADAISEEYGWRRTGSPGARLRHRNSGALPSSRTAK